MTMPSSAPPTKGGTRLDHVGFIVADLDAASELVSQLGFTQTMRADHTRSNAEGKLVSAGSSQRSVMFHDGYIEFMQITDAKAGHQLAPAIQVRHGLHVIALGTSDAAACRASLVQGGVAAGPLLNWSRPINEGVHQGLARFCYFDSSWDAHDPSYICWVQHLTPELIRPAPLLQHDNRAMALSGVRYRGPRHLAAPWAAQLARSGSVSSSPCADGAEVSFPNALFRVDFDENMPTLLPSALVLAFSDLAGLRVQCRRLGLSVRELGTGAIDLDLEQQLGLHWICVPGAA